MKYVIWNPAGWLWENSFWCYFLTISVFLWSTCCFSLTQNKDAWEGFRVVEEYKREGRLLITKNNCWHWRHAFLNCFVNWKLQMFCREICKAHSTMDCGLAVMISRILFYLTLYLGISHGSDTFFSSVSVIFHQFSAHNIHEYEFASCILVYLSKQNAISFPSSTIHGPVLLTITPFPILSYVACVYNII